MRAHGLFLRVSVWISYYHYFITIPFPFSFADGRLTVATGIPLHDRCGVMNHAHTHTHLVSTW